MPQLIQPCLSWHVPLRIKHPLLDNREGGLLKGREKWGFAEGNCQWGGSPMQIQVLHVVDLHTSRKCRKLSLNQERQHEVPLHQTRSLVIIYQSVQTTCLGFNLDLEPFGRWCIVKLHRTCLEAAAGGKKGKRKKTQKPSTKWYREQLLHKLCKWLKKWGRNYLIHTNCMYSLVVNFDEEESSK